MQSWCGAGKGSQVAGRPFNTGSERQRRDTIDYRRDVQIEMASTQRLRWLWCHRSITCQDEDSRRSLEPLTGGWWVCEALWKRIVKATASLGIASRNSIAAATLRKAKSHRAGWRHTKCLWWTRLEKGPCRCAAYYASSVG
ncbi:hypothetical protein PMIN01_02659 [Paraphaeosphaeria minitans]|uniref:Uncharacterized protein n=1 Tax=Paraphaeosphaeria minitans TaxID=565426 RepID=A0A9P6GR45_9PLEO|nr:hypothetical protein PMIN01_02659 [Paraphaeosphaeria minitans]